MPVPPNPSDLNRPDHGVNPAASPAPGQEALPADDDAPHRRRRRYQGKYPRRFEQKYKEHRPELYPETIGKVIASGKTPAGSHRPIMVDEVLQALVVGPGMAGVDCTLGWGGHAEAFLKHLSPGGRLIGLDADPLQLPRTVERLRAAGYEEEMFAAFRSNFAGLPSVLGKANLTSVDFVFADLGVSSMQLDNPARGFSFKTDGPLDMRMNPGKPVTAADLLRTQPAEVLAAVFRDNADEPHAATLAQGLAGREFPTTSKLAKAIDQLLGRTNAEEREACKRRVFQALRIAVNQEFTALETLLRALPLFLAPGGRAAFLTFHSGEDRRVKQAFLAGSRAGIYSSIAPEVVRPSAAEVGANPRAKPAKLRWAVRASA